MRIVLMIASIALCAPLAHAMELGKFIEFKKMEKGHKSDWLDYMQKVHNDKYSLMKSHNAQWVDNGIQNLRGVEDNEDCSVSGKNELFSHQLKDAIALHKKQMAEFKKMCHDHYQEGEAIQARHEKELGAFEETAFPVAAKGALKK